jgi:hypothetical protein
MMSDPGDWHVVREDDDIRLPASFVRNVLTER